MQVFEFMGNNIELAEDVQYYPPLDYWVKLDREQQTVTFGLTPTGNIKEGGYRSLEFLVEEGDEVSQGDMIAVSITTKVKYLESIAGGKILSLNQGLEEEIIKLEGKPFAECWLAIIATNELEGVNRMVTGAEEYKNKLNDFAQCAPPPGVKAGSPTCRSVYAAIKQQKES